MFDAIDLEEYVTDFFPSKEIAYVDVFGCLFRLIILSLRKWWLATSQDKNPLRTLLSTEESYQQIGVEFCPCAMCSCFK